jgi:menaquinol-cytochrome c reductase iron-sulfur subunit
LEIFDMNTTNPSDSPPAERSASPEELSRRRFFERLSVALGSLCAAILAIPSVGFIIAPLFGKTPQLWRTVGKVTEFEVGKTVSVAFEDSTPLRWAGVTARTAAWLRRVTESDFIAFAVNCSHLGCPVRWMQDANLFMCPCHGGVYYADGSVAAGPPPYALTRYDVRVKNGEVQLLTQPIPIR